MFFPAAQVSPTQRSIARAWRLHFARLQHSQGRTLIRVIYPSQLSAKSPVVVGTFTSPAWSQKVPMSYSIRAKSYIREIWMCAKDRFQVVDTARAVLLPDFLQSPYHRGNGEVCMLPARSSFQLRAFLHFCAQKTSRSPVLCFQAAASVFAKAGKRLEDAHFLDTGMLGVADGVGGWRALGVDSGLFAGQLMQECQKQTLWSWPGPSKAADSDLKPVAEEALSRTEACGSATLLLAALHMDMLELLNLGDSRAVLIRFHANKPEIVLATTSMQHSFNTPFQLSKPLTPASKAALLQRSSPEKAKDLTRAFLSRKLINDHVKKAEVYKVRVRPGDLLVLGSDGLWDNLFEQEVLGCVAEGCVAGEIARRLAKAAYTKSVGRGKTPFELEAAVAYGPCAWRGGKEDDITVIAAWIRQEPTWPRD